MVTASVSGVVGCVKGLGRGKLAAILTAAIALAATDAARAVDHYDVVGPVTSLCAFTTTANVNGTNVSGYTHLEGPISDGNGGILFCELHGSDASKDLIWRWTIGAAAGSSPTLVSANSGGTQGFYKLDADHYVTADRDTRKISTRTTSNVATATTLVSNWVNGSNTYGFYGPNDLVADAKGGVYFTDPNFTNKSGTYGQDEVFYISGGTVTKHIDCGSKRPNGIVLSPDGNTLYVGMWNSGTVEAYSVGSDGGLTYLRTPITGVNSPDGMTIDPWGNLIIARSGGVSCYDMSNPLLTNQHLWDLTVNSNTSATNVEVYDNTLYVTTYGNNSVAGSRALYSVALMPTAPVPEPATLGVMGAGLAVLLCRRRR
jgi:gluconolactonase